MSGPLLSFRRRLRIMLPWVAVPFLTGVTLFAAAWGRRPPVWLGYLFGATVVLPGVGAWLIDRAEDRLRRRWESGQCLACGYDLTGNISGVCPECGTAVK